MATYTQQEHDAALQQLRDEFEATIANMQTEIDAANAQVTELQHISSKYDALKQGVAAFAGGLPEGEQQLLRVLISQTAGGPEKLLAIERMILNSNLATIQARLNQIG